MPKYFMTWEVDPTKVPADLKERSAMWSVMLETIKQEMKEGIITEWGCFVGEARGYSIDEESPEDLAKSLQQFYPYVTFEVHQVMTADELGEVLKSLAE